MTPASIVIVSEMFRWTFFLTFLLLLAAHFLLTVKFYFNFMGYVFITFIYMLTLSLQESKACVEMGDMTTSQGQKVSLIMILM